MPYIYVNFKMSIIAYNIFVYYSDDGIILQKLSVICL